MYSKKNSSSTPPSTSDAERQPPQRKKKMSYFIHSLDGYDFRLNLRCKCVPMVDREKETSIVEHRGSGISSPRSSGPKDVKARLTIRKGKWPEGTIQEISEFGEFKLKPERRSSSIGDAEGAASKLMEEVEDINDWTFVLKENVLYILQDEFDLEPMYALDVSQYILYTSPTMTEHLTVKLAHSSCVSYFLKAQQKEDFQNCLQHLAQLADDVIYLS